MIKFTFATQADLANWLESMSTDALRKSQQDIPIKEQRFHQGESHVYQDLGRMFRSGEIEITVRNTGTNELEDAALKALNCYQTVMSLRANAVEIISFITTHNLCAGVNWRGCNKADVARSIALSGYKSASYKWKEDTLKLLLENFSTK